MKPADLINAKTDASVVALAAIESAQKPTVEYLEENTHPFAVLPNGQGGYVHVSLEDYLDRPLRVREALTLADVGSLIDYLKLYGSKASSIVFANPVLTELSFTAVLDYHDVDTTGVVPGHRAHRVLTKLTPTVEWAEWSAIHGKDLDQLTFAQFLEDRLSQIAKLDGSSLIEMIRKFESFTAVNFKSHHRVEDGTMSIVYDEQTNAGPQGGKIATPTGLTLVIAPFQGSNLRSVDVRIRLKRNASSLMFRAEIINRQQIIQEEFNLALSRVKDETAAKCVKAVLLGTASS